MSAVVAHTGWGTLFTRQANGTLRVPAPAIAYSIADADGNVVLSGSTDENGQIAGSLPSGQYTLTERGETKVVNVSTGSADASKVYARDHGVTGLGVADDTAGVLAAIAALPATGGEVVLPYPYVKVDLGTITVDSGVRLTGGGGGLITNGSDHDGVTTIVSSYDGKVIDVPVDAAGWSIEGLTIRGDRTKASQDLLTLSQTVPGFVRDVSLTGAGRDGLKLDGTLNVHFDRLSVEKSKRYNLYSGVYNSDENNGANANLFSSCTFREADQWGVRWSSGQDVHFDRCTFESNSRDTGTSYGGMLVDGATSWCNITLTAPHFENNVGLKSVSPTGVPLSVSVPTKVPTTITEIGAEYSEVNPVVLDGGRLSSVGVRSNIEPYHAVIGASHEGAVWINPRRWGAGASSSGAGSFDVLDNSNKSIIIGDGISDGLPGFKIGGDTALVRNAANEWQTPDHLRWDRPVDELVWSTRRTGEAFARAYVNSDGYHLWGPGSSGADTTLGRVGVGVVAVTKLGVGNSAAATTPGSVVKKIQVYDENGTSLGYVPVYSSIT